MLVMCWDTVLAQVQGPGTAPLSGDFLLSEKTVSGTRERVVRPWAGKVLGFTMAQTPELGLQDVDEFLSGVSGFGNNSGGGVLAYNGDNIVGWSDGAQDQFLGYNSSGVLGWHYPTDLAAQAAAMAAQATADAALTLGQAALVAPVTAPSGGETLYFDGNEWVGIGWPVPFGSGRVLLSHPSGTAIESAAGAVTGAPFAWDGAAWGPGTRLALSGDGAASQSGLRLTGSVFSGGTGTTNLPLMFVEPSGATAGTTWSTAGTLVGGNALAAFAGNLLDFRVGGASRFRVSNTGNIIVAPNMGIGAYESSQIKFFGGYIEMGQTVGYGTKIGLGGIFYGPSAGVVSLDRVLGLRPGAAPAASATAGEWLIYVDSGDANKLKAKASTGTTVLLGTP